MYIFTVCILLDIYQIFIKKRKSKKKMRMLSHLFQNVLQFFVKMNVSQSLNTFSI